MNESVLEILNDFSRIIGEKERNIDYILDKESKKVILLNKKFIIKIDKSKILEKELFFFNIYNNDNYEKIIYSDLNKGYVVYEYIHGCEANNIENWNNILNTLKENVKKYETYNKKWKKFLYNDENTWLTFFKIKIIKNLEFYSPNEIEIKILKKAFKRLEKNSGNLKVLHGDLGIYNIIFSKSDKKIKIIDPYPIVGKPNYDILTFFCSSIKILDYFGINNIIDFLGGNKEENICLFIIVLYLRICIESKHNTQTVKRYLKIWKKIIEMGELL